MQSKLQAQPSRRLDRHFADALSPFIFKHLLKVKGDAAEWQARRRLPWPRPIERCFGRGRGALPAHLQREVVSERCGVGQRLDDPRDLAIGETVILLTISLHPC